MAEMAMTRCAWVGPDPLYQRYHDTEWGIPVKDDRKLFEALVLGGAQAGLSWLTVLKKRESYREAFDGFDPRIVSAYDESRIGNLLENPGIIRNRLKVGSAVTNARRVLEVQREFGTFSEFLWGFVDHRPIQNRWAHIGEVPASTTESDLLSQEMRKRGFKFAGSTICYAIMQAVGMVNDHTVDCFRYHQVARLSPD